MPRRVCVHPEPRTGSGHGAYAEILSLIDSPDYENAWDRGYKDGPRVA